MHWPSTVENLGVGGVSFVELLILFERWAGERLVLESAGPSIDIWQSCTFLAAMLRDLGRVAWKSW